MRFTGEAQIAISSLWIHPVYCVFSTGGVFSIVGEILSTAGDHLSNVRRYVEYRGGCSVLWGDIMLNVGALNNRHTCIMKYYHGNEKEK